MEHELTVRQRQRIGAKMSRYVREIGSKLNKRNEKFRGLLLEMIERCYKDGFNDGIETTLDELERQRKKPRY